MMANMALSRLKMVREDKIQSICSRSLDDPEGRSIPTVRYPQSGQDGENSQEKPLN